MLTRLSFPETMEFQQPYVADLSLFLKDDHLSNIRENSRQQWEDDGGPSKEPSIGP